MRHKMETENKLRNGANWSNQQQTFPWIITLTKAAQFSRLAQSAYIPGEALFQADLFSIS